MNFWNRSVLIVAAGAAFFLLPIQPAVSQDDLILPLPKQMAPPPPVKAKEPPKDSVRGTILPLPTKIKREPQKGKEVNPSLVLPLPRSKQPKGVEPSITIPVSPPSAPVPPGPNLGENAGTIVIPSSGGQATVQIGAEPPVSAAPVAGAPLPPFPKDTSSAIFMVMKTWECQDYDGPTLVEHALGVYGQEAEDQFAVKGLLELPPFRLTLNEEDVTLDELLDVIAQQAKCDWGVDIPQKTVYLYPGKVQP